MYMRFMIIEGFDYDEDCIVHRILERGRTQRANLVCVKKKGSRISYCVSDWGKEFAEAA